MKCKRKNKPRRSFILKILILGVCVYMVITLTNLWAKLSESEKQLDSLKAEYNNYQNDIEELKVMLKGESNSQIIEKAARERLGYIYSDEQVFVDISGN